MTKKVKIILSLCLLFAFMFVGVVFYASKKITPEEVRKISLSFLKKNFPKAKIELGKIDYSLGLSIKFSVNKFNLHMPRGVKSSRELTHFEDLQVKIPIWSILTGGGTISIRIENPKFNYYEFKNKGNNWSVAQSGKTEKQVKTSAAKSKKSKVSSAKLALPSFLLRSKLDIKLINTAVAYRLQDKTSGELTFSRILIKNLNFENTSAFELASKMVFSGVYGKKTSMDALVIGQVNLKEFVDKGDFHPSMLMTLSNIKVPEITNEIPEIKTNIDFILKKNGAIHIDSKTSFGNIGDFNVVVDMKNKKIKLEKIKGSFLISELLAFSSSSLPIKAGNKSKFELKGSAVLNSGKLSPNLEFSIFPGVTIKAHSLLDINTEIKGTLVRKDFKLSILSKFWEGTTTINAQTKINPMKFTKIPPVKVQVVVSHLNIKKDVLQKMLYDKNAASENEKINSRTNSKTKKKKSTPAPILPTVSLDLKINQVKIAGEEFSGITSIAIKGSQIAAKKFRFNFSKGKGSLSFLINLLKNDAKKTNLDFKVKNLNLKFMHAFLPPAIDNVHGIFSGKIKGTIHSRPAPKAALFDINLDFMAKDGELKGLNIASYIQELVASIPMLKKKVDKKDLKVSDEFEVLNLKAHLKSNKMNFKKIHFIGIKKKAEIKGKGIIYPLATTKKGRMDFTLADNKGPLSKMLETQVGLNALPIRLTGIQYSLKPDYAYTLKIIGKKAAKKKGKKFLQKALKGKNKKLDKLLDGFFK